MSDEFRLWLSVIAVTRFALTRLVQLTGLSQRERGGIATLARPNSKRLPSAQTPLPVILHFVLVDFGQFPRLKR